LPPVINDLQLGTKKKKEQIDLQYNFPTHFKGKLFHIIKRKLLRQTLISGGQDSQTPCVLSRCIGMPYFPPNALHVPHVEGKQMLPSSRPTQESHRLGCGWIQELKEESRYSRH